MACPSGRPAVEADARRLAAFAAKYRWLAGCKITSYYTAACGAPLPAAWAEVVRAAPLPALAKALRGDAAGLADAAGAPLPDDLATFLEEVEEGRTMAPCARGDGDEALAARCAAHAHGPSAAPPPLPPLFFRGVKAKKAHEIARLAPLVDEVARAAGATHVVDIGAGRGYLSRVLAQHYGWQVVAVESQELHVAAGKKLDEQVAAALEKERRKGGGAPPVPTPQRIRWVCATLGSADPAAFEALLAEEPDAATCAPRRYLLVGLHSCGDLSSKLATLAARWGAAAGVVVVGCCHMHTTEAEPAADDAGTQLLAQRRPECRDASNVKAIHAAAQLAKEGATAPGFPLSQALSGVALGTQLRELACAELAGYAARLEAAAEGGCEEAVGQLQLHCWRGLAERIMREALGDAAAHTRLSVRSIPHAWKMSFNEYVAAALARMKIEGEGGAPCDYEALYAAELAAWQEVVGFNVLRLACAPALERLLAADRHLYLLEHGMDATVLPVFDPAVSPRALAVAGVKGPLSAPPAPPAKRRKTDEA